MLVWRGHGSKAVDGRNVIKLLRSALVPRQKAASGRTLTIVWLLAVGPGAVDELKLPQSASN